MTDTTPKFDPIPRLQQIAVTIEESGADIFDAPATAVHYIECAIKEIERLRAERDEARRLYCIAFQEITENLGEKNTTESIAEEMGWDCFKENTNAQE
jgi:hypothetical protein